MIKHIALALSLLTASLLAGCGESSVSAPTPAKSAEPAKPAKPAEPVVSKFVEGKHFTQISDKAPSSQPKLTEFYSFYCHNCFNMETQYLGDIKASLNKNVKFDSKHVDFMNSEIGTEVMRSLAVIQELDAGDKMTHAMFAAIQGDEGAHGHNHEQDNTVHKKPELNNRDDIKKVFANNGFDISKYDAIADSKVVNDKIDLWRVQQREFNVQSVPAFIVNDKYAVNMGQVNTLGELIDLINYLAVEHK